MHFCRTNEKALKKAKEMYYTSTTCFISKNNFINIIVLYLVYFINNQLIMLHSCNDNVLTCSTKILHF